MSFDPVTKPAHYNLGGIECLDAMEASMTEDEFLGYLKGNVFKYLWRWRHKGKGVEDLGKAQFYLKLLAERVKSRQEKIDKLPKFAGLPEIQRHAPSALPWHPQAGPAISPRASEGI